MTGIGLNGSLYLGAKSLSTQQQAISIIGNNISNVNTPGYARQRANLTESEVLTGADGEQGTGSVVSNIESIRSSLLDGLVQQSLGGKGYADDNASLTATVQSALGETFNSTTTSGSTSTTSSGAIQTGLSNFFGALQSLAASPNDPSVRQSVVSDATEVATSLNSAYTRIQQTQSDIASDASSISDQINALATNIAGLNKQIIQVQSAGNGAPANDLVDNRAQDIDQLANLININTSTQSNGSINITLADAPSVSLVTGINGGGTGTTQSLSVSYSPNSATPLTVTASTSGALGAGVPSSGSLGSHLEVANNIIGAPAADGGTGLLASLDGVASSLMTQMNTLNQGGYTLSNTLGGAFFTGSGAGNIAVSSSIVSNPSLIAAASSANSPLDGTNAQKMANIQNGTAVAPAFQTIVADLGSTVSGAAQNQSVQDQVTAQLQNQQQSVSGVSIDEEMTNLISFQQAYSASARFITTISSMYNTLLTSTQ